MVLRPCMRTGMQIAGSRSCGLCVIDVDIRNRRLELRGRRTKGTSPRQMAATGWSGPLKRLLLAATIVVALVAVGVPALRARSVSPVPQPIDFSHRKHTVDLQLGCEFCHKYFQTSAHSGLPGAETCGICHTVVLGTSPEAAKLTDLLQKGEPLRFNKLFRLPDYVFYTHRRHVALGKLDCTNCHGGIADTDSPPGRPLVQIRMVFCVSCHKARGVTTDCTACHR